ncbi:hypothetical protein D9M71_718440 [compost metagenome]
MQVNVSQRIAFAHLARQFEHGLAIVQCRDLGEAPRQFRQEGTVAGADLDCRGSAAKAQFVEQGHHAFAVLRQAGDQVLLGAKFLGDP